MSDELYYFNEDAQEQLQMMESALLDAMDKGANSEYIGTIFRAMHTIKGVAGMFNFKEIISFTHIAENLMDAVRNGKIEVDEKLLMLMLQCKDHVSELVISAVKSTPLSDSAMMQDELLKAAIGQYLQAPSTKSLSANTQSKPQKTLGAQLWHISVQLKESFFESGMDLISIMAFLNKIGKIRSVQPLLDRLPILEDIDPLMPYISFEIEFEGDVDKSEIEEVFEFVEDDIELVIKKGDLSPLVKDSALNKPQKPLEQQQTAQLKAAASQSLRVDSSKIDLLIDTIGEMVIANAKISRYAEKYDDSELEEVVVHFESLLENLRGNVMNIRMLPVGESFEKLRRIVNDVAYKLGKKINFNIIGGETELDKTVIEKIADPLVHMLRNAVDHGIEMPENRIQAGKAEFGNIELRAYPESGAIVIEIEDDGKGLEPEFLRNKAVSKGIISADKELSANEAFQLIFEPGFSTAEVISDISGRGVGMDVVKNNIEALKGNIELSSEVGKGSRFTIRLPLTLAIIDGFLLQAGATKYVIPLEMVSEVIEYTQKQHVEIIDSNLFDLRGTLLPLLNVGKFYKEEIHSRYERQNIVIVKYAKQRMGLLVDELFGEYQTVIKSLGGLFADAPGLYGASILGSGEIALIFDIPALFELVNGDKPKQGERR